MNQLQNSRQDKTLQLIHQEIFNVDYDLWLLEQQLENLLRDISGTKHEKDFYKDINKLLKKVKNNA